MLISSPISDDISCIPPATIDAIRHSRNFVCERIRTSRRYIRSVLPDFDINKSSFVELDKHGSVEEHPEIISWMKKDIDIAFLSEAGVPCVADPGARLVRWARSEGYKIIPYSGPSSIIMALMASGLNGQNFTFHGYLPVKKGQLAKRLKELEKAIQTTGYTQIFIETPYRNLSLFQDILNQMDGRTCLSISIGLTTAQQFIDCKTLSKWKEDKAVKNIFTQKIPSIFLLGK